MGGAEGGGDTPIEISIGQSVGQRAETPIKRGAEDGDPNGGGCRVKCGAGDGDPSNVWGRGWGPPMDVIVGQSVGQRAETPVMCGAEGGNPNGDLYRAKCGAEGGDPNKVWG